MNNTNKKQPRGYFVVLVLVFSAVFFTLISALSGYIFVEKRAQLAKENREKAIHIAEAGLEYYRWFLAHNPGDVTNGTGQPGPYEQTVSDPEGAVLGTYSLDVQGDVFCGDISRITIASTGWTAADPRFKRTLSAAYLQPSVAEFSHIVEANVWAGADRVINGPYHSNNGVRMDATHNATVSSGVQDWLCTISFGCDPDSTQDGVFGSGGPQNLWKFPVPPVDFNGITVDLNTIKNHAQSSGLYFPPTGKSGYRVTFNADGSADIREVVGAIEIWGYSTDGGWAKERTVMSSVSSAANYVIPPDCPLIFLEDDVWIEGVVAGKALIAAADLSGSSIDRSVILNDNITYAGTGNDGLTVIGEQDVLVGLQVPDIMNIFGVFIAQKGKFGRNHYCTYDCSTTKGNQGLPGSLDEYVTRSTLNTTGTVVSKGRVGTKWTSGGAFVSGFDQRNDSFDRSLAENPPPFTPVTSDDYIFRSWQEVD